LKQHLLLMPRAAACMTLHAACTPKLLWRCGLETILPKTFPSPCQAFAKVDSIMGCIIPQTLDPTMSLMQCAAMQLICKVLHRRNPHTPSAVQACRRLEDHACCHGCCCTDLNYAWNHPHKTCTCWNLPDHPWPVRFCTLLYPQRNSFLLLLLLLLLSAAAAHLVLHMLYKVQAICLQGIIHTHTQQPSCCHNQAAAQPLRPQHSAAWSSTGSTGKNAAGQVNRC
jgi:hypothetical protein